MSRWSADPITKRRTLSLRANLHPRLKEWLRDGAARNLQSCVADFSGLLLIHLVPLVILF
jgi:hypothetical protein